MNRHFTTLFWTLLLLLCPAISRADRIGTDHYFKNMDKETELKFSNSNATAETELLTYQCSTDAKFALYSTILTLKLPTGSKYVTTTCINELAEFQITHYPDSKIENIKVYVSKDGSTWSPALSGDSITYYSGSIDVTLPRNNYYVRILNASGSIVYIPRIVWYQDHCNCFIYNPE